ncbi:chemotaxis protein [Methyloraptor flagellatus]|uniref:Chemotaxis protein n=1 Tax=Methyloraptor flagellatus TaxID=3162530 RepID=A0AAU7XBC4_9HYPH
MPIEDYDAIEAAVMETARGRWFLQEYARRNRNADTGVILNTLERLEKTIKRERQVPDIDRIRLDLADMAEAITRTKQEIATMKLETEHGGRFSEASAELDAIVEQTEMATNDILLNAEKIQELAWTLREAKVDDALCDQLDTCSTEIYTACSFQDLTGQRTRKVVTVLRYLESRINSMIGIWGLGDSEVVMDMQTSGGADPMDTRPDAHLLNGPQLAGRGVDQSAVDDLMDYDVVAEGTDGGLDSHATTVDLDDPEIGGIDMAEEIVSDADFAAAVDPVEPEAREADVFAAPETPSATETAEADVFAPATPAPKKGKAKTTTPVVTTVTVGNTVVAVSAEAAAELAPEASPALTVVANLDPIAELSAEQRLVVFG